LKRLAEIWSSFPPGHKKRFFQGMGLYLAVIAFAVALVAHKGNQALHDQLSHTPSVQVAVKDVYLNKAAGTTGTAAVTTAAATPTTMPAPMPQLPPDGKIYVALVMSDLGLSADETQIALSNLPDKVALAFSPYADDVQDWIKKARKLNHEALIEMPMETAEYPDNDPGPRAVSSRFSDADNNNNIQWLLAKGKGANGVVNLMGSHFLTDRKRLSAVFETLWKNRYIFVETPGIKDSVGASTADQTNIPYLAADLKIDAETTDEKIRQSLDDLEKLARSRGYAVGIAEPYPLSVNVIKSWAADLNARGITLAPLNTVLQHKPRHEDAAVKGAEAPTTAPPPSAALLNSGASAPPPDAQLKKP
jgi:polysaccharide deacetylase 2 family uncharacterized protein YibQ